MENRRFTEKGHVHELFHEGEWKKLTGATQVLSVIAKPALIPWAARMCADYIRDNLKSLDDLEQVLEEGKNAHRKTKESAGDFGTEVHKIIEDHIKISIEKKEEFFTKLEFTHTDKKVEKAVNMFFDWATKNRVRFLESEKLVHSIELWVGGIADFVCEIDGERYVGDIKTSSGIYPEHFIQASTYAKMLEEMGEGTFKGVIIVNPTKKGQWNERVNYAIEQNYEVFKACLTIKRGLEAIK